MAFDRTLVLIRERSFLDLLDLALVVVRRRPLAIGLAAAAGTAPWAAAYAWLAADPTMPGILLFYLGALAVPWATAPLTVLLGGLMFGERPTAGRIVRTVFRALPALFLYQGILRALVVMPIVLTPLIPTRLAFLDEVILLERGRGAPRSRQSISARSGALCGDRGGELFGQWFGLIAYGLGFVLAFRWAVEMLVEVLFHELTWDKATLEDPTEWVGQQAIWLFDARAWSTQFGLWILVAFVGVVRFLTYIDQRIRLEGWEVELRLRAAGAALEDAERW